ncbi:MAG: NAD(P)/FAD-dependent oxidoreductase [Nevskia sp.]|nr:NAD(P)/FAD-dependent oxidoreductase [Nevskia sp.]
MNAAVKPLLADPQAEAPAQPAAKALYEAVIVGCGFGGMGVAIQLGRMGIDDILMLDQSDDLGGTWHQNTYPGLAVDIPSVTYSYSFEPNPNWSRLYAPGAELKSYTQHVADKYRLRRFMRFNATVEKAEFDEGRQHWTVHVAGQPPVRAKVLVIATGYLSHPKRPDIPGLDSFAGKVIHTARWDHGYDLAGKRAAVIGTGATAVQLLPRIAPLLTQLDVYQRTPIWVSPKYDPKITAWVRRLFAALPFTQRLARFATSSFLEAITYGGVLHNRSFAFMTRSVEQTCKAHLARQIKDPELRRKLTPQYSFGCKRPTFANNYYPTFNRSNVELVTDPIERIEADGIVTRDGRKRAIDTLILATGFKVCERGNFPAFEVVGRNGMELGDWWERERYQSYEGITMPGFPNLFLLPSPYSYTGLSFFFTVEGQMKHIKRCLGEMRRRQARTFEVTREANDAYVRRMKARLAQTVFLNGNCASANSYYFDRNGEVSIVRPMPVATMHWRSAHFPLSDYRFA